MHTLFESGTSRIQELERYINDDVIRHGNRLNDLEKKLSNAYQEFTSTEALDDDALFANEDDEEEESAFVMYVPYFLIYEALLIVLSGVSSPMILARTSSVFVPWGLLKSWVLQTSSFLRDCSRAKRTPRMLLLRMYHSLLSPARAHLWTVRNLQNLRRPIRLHRLLFHSTQALSMVRLGCSSRTINTVYLCSRQLIRSPLYISPHLSLFFPTTRHIPHSRKLARSDKFSRQTQPLDRRRRNRRRKMLQMPPRYRSPRPRLQDCW